MWFRNSELVVVRERDDVMRVWAGDVVGKSQGDGVDMG